MLNPAPQPLRHPRGWVGVDTRNEQSMPRPDQAAGLRKLLLRPHTQVITVLGAHAGLGVTAVVNNLASAFTRCGKNVLVLDENIACDNVGNSLGLLPRYDLLHAVRGDKKWHDVMLHSKDTAYVMPVARAMQALPQLDGSARVRLTEILRKAAADKDVVLVDAARGGRSVCAKLSGAQTLLLVMDATAEGITASYALLKQMAQHHGHPSFDIVVNKVQGEQEALSVFDNIAHVAQRHLQVQLEYTGFIPQDTHIPRAAQMQRPVVVAFPAAPSALAMREVAQGLMHIPSHAHLQADAASQVMPRFPSLSPRAALAR